MSIDPARKIEIEAAAARQLLSSIAEIVADDDEAKADAIEGETHLFEAIDRALERMTDLDVLKIGIEAHLAKLEERLKRFEKQDERLRSAIFAAMTTTGQKKIERPLATVSIRPGTRSVIVSNMDLLPVWFKRLAEWQPDKRAIGAALKEGQIVPGAMLSPAADTLAIRGL